MVRFQHLALASEEPRWRITGIIFNNSDQPLGLNVCTIVNRS